VSDTPEDRPVEWVNCYDDIVDRREDALINAVNCVGVAGKGVALRFRERFPDNYHAYRTACRQKTVKTGRMFVFRTMTTATPRYIINFPTKKDWRDPSHISYIDTGLWDLARTIVLLGVRSIAIPRLGCGCGGLDWGEVWPKIYWALYPINCLQEVTVCHPLA